MLADLDGAAAGFAPMNTLEDGRHRPACRPNPGRYCGARRTADAN